MRKFVIIIDRMQKLINNEKKKDDKAWSSFKSLISIGKMSKFIAITSLEDDFKETPDFKYEKLQIRELWPL